MPRPWLLLCLILAACAQDPDDAEHRLENRLLSPCCWRQALFDHESPIATALRAEIHARLSRGESDDAIEADLVARYGPALRVAPAPAPVGAVVVGAAVLLLGGLVFRFRPRRRALATLSAVDDGDDGYRDRLDDELAAID